MTKIQSILVFIAAAIMLAAAVTLTNFAQAEVTGKALEPPPAGCPVVPGIGIPLGIGAWNAPNPRMTIICIETADEWNRGQAQANWNQPYTVTTSAREYVVEGRRVNTDVLVRIVRTIELSPPPSPTPSDPPDDGNAQTPDNTSDNTPSQTAPVQAKSSNDAKRLAQYGAAGFAAFVLIHNYWLGAPLGVLPLNMAYNDKGAIFSGTSFRISPQETIHLSALESVDDKRGEYKFGVQWHYQFAPPRGLTETPAAALPAIYTMPNVTPKDWLNE